MIAIERGTKNQIKHGDKLYMYHGAECYFAGIDLEDKLIMVSFVDGKVIRTRKCLPKVCNLELVEEIPDPRERMTEAGKKCCDLYWLYSSGQITRNEMDRRREELESKQLSLQVDK